MLTELLTAHTDEHLLLHLEDWKERNRRGRKLGVAWLIESIRNNYTLAKPTTERIEREQNQLRAERRRQTERQQADEIDQLEQAAEQMFDSMSDEELEALKAECIASYGPLAARHAKKNPRQCEPLRRLMIGKLGAQVREARSTDVALGVPPRPSRDAGDSPDRNGKPSLGQDGGASQPQYPAGNGSAARAECSITFPREDARWPQIELAAAPSAKIQPMLCESG